MNKPPKPPITWRKPPFHSPLWIRHVSPRQFPYAPQELYFYLCAFEPWTCHLSNSRLARKFHVTDRTIRRWLAWLTKNHLIWTRWFELNHRQINCHYFNTASEWYSALALTNISAKVSQ